MSKIINKIDDELINSIYCDEINIYCSTEDDAKELLNQLYFIGYKWRDDTPIDKTYFNNTDCDGIIYNIYKCNNTITYWGSNHNYDFEFKLEKNNNSNNMKEVFEFNWKDFEDKKLLIRVNNYDEQVKCIDFISNHYNVDKKYIDYCYYEEDWNHIIYCILEDSKWSRIHKDYLEKDDIYIEFKNIKQEESEQINIDNNLKISKEFDFEKWKDEGLYVIVNSKEEAINFLSKLWNYFGIVREHRDNICGYIEKFDLCRNLIYYDEQEKDKWLRIGDYAHIFNDIINNKKDKVVNWSDYMDKENITQILKNTLGEPHVEKVVDTSIYKRIDDTKQDIKQAFVDIDTSVLYKTRELFDTIRDEKDIEKIRNTLNIIDRLVITKNKVLNDFDIDMIDELK